jgi:hypothetical protein
LVSVNPATRNLILSKTSLRNSHALTTHNVFVCD